MKKFGRLCAATALVSLAVILAGQRAGALDEPPSWKKMDKEALAKLLEKGELASVDYVGPQNLEMCSVGILADAPPEKVWKSITDFDDYGRLMPDMTAAKVIERGANTAVVQFNVTVLKVGMITITTEYTLRYHLDPPRRADISWVSGQVKNVTGYWELFLVDGGRKTVVIYAITSDLASANKLVGAALREQPSTVMAINLSSAIVLTRLIVEKAEKM